MALVATGSRVDELKIQTPAEIRARLASLTPVTFIPALGAHKASIEAFLSRFHDVEAVFIREPLASPDDETNESLFTHPVLVLSTKDHRLALAGAQHDATGFAVRVVRSDAGDEQSGRVTGFDSQARVIGQAPFRFTGSALETEARFTQPTMLTNEITRLSIEGVRSTGGVWLMSARSLRSGSAMNQTGRDPPPFQYFTSGASRG